MIAVCTFFRLKRFGETLKIACNSDAVPRAIALVAFRKLQWIRFHGVNRSAKEERRRSNRACFVVDETRWCVFVLVPIRLSSTGGKNWWKRGGKKTWNSMTTSVDRDQSDRRQYKQENIRLFAASQNTYKAQPRMSLYVGISTHACTQHAHCVYTRDNSKSRRQRRINSRQGWIYLSWHLQIPDPFVDTVNTSTTISSLRPI